MGECSLFQLFSADPGRFSADALKASYHALMRKVHPDAASPLSLSQKQELSGVVTQGYARLKDEYSRSIYKYSLNNSTKNILRKELAPGAGEVLGLKDPVTLLDIEKEQVGCTKRVSQEFLDQILSLEEALKHGSPEEIESARKEIEAGIEECKKNSNSIDYLVQWRYFNRLKDYVSQINMLE